MKLVYKFSEISDGEMNEDESVRSFAERHGFNRVVIPRLEHEANVKTVVGVGEPRIAIVEDADALTLAAPGVALSVRGADCFGVMLYYGEDKLPVGIAHAGWRGLRRDVVKKLARHMHEEYGREDSLKAIIGPGIRQCCFEVGADVWERFYPNAGSQVDLSTISYAGTKKKLDLVHEIKKQLAAEGVGVRDIMDTGLCTKCGTKFHSYRREGKTPDGRIRQGVAIIGII